MKKVSVSKCSNFKLGKPIDVVKLIINDCSNKLKTVLVDEVQFAFFQVLIEENQMDY